MKKLFSLMSVVLLVLVAMPMVAAEGGEVNGSIDIGIDVPNTAPVIFQDPTQRSWYPNDQTWYTADEYGSSSTNLYGDEFYEVDARGNYIFTGETVTYYVIVEDIDGENDIESVYMDNFGACAEIIPPNTQDVKDYTDDEYSNWQSYAADKFSLENPWDDNTMNLYRCKLIATSANSGEDTVTIVAEDEMGNYDEEEKETLEFNPSLSVSLTGTFDFGTTLVPGSTATSTPVKLRNVGSNGVVMDMYVASDDYFTDSGNSMAICGDGNGIKYDQFSYYATKGSLDSGENNAQYEGLGAGDGKVDHTIPAEVCESNPDEYTTLPSHSGEIADMCRIINHREDGSLLTQGDYMTIKMRVEIPSNCESGSYTDGEFHFVGRVV